ncbi:unnamed protein product [Clavelina lepadiformis]|uniref:Uncharacterized protein n=1 Tax=Clavelina lepadiformis TaxID=159417 RepID=A0ABP0F283_CLALP
MSRIKSPFVNTTARIKTARICGHNFCSKSVPIWQDLNCLLGDRLTNIAVGSLFDLVNLKLRYNLVKECLAMLKMFQLVTIDKTPLVNWKKVQQHSSHFSTGFSSLFQPLAITRCFFFSCIGDHALSCAQL